MIKKSFSVIIPCYNSEDYIEKCIDSLVEQNYDFSLIQVLLIDDGSKTNALEEIAKKYISKYPNIEYYKKENGNWGSVINYVLENKLAKNDYVSILDSDDFLNKNCFKIVNKLSKNNDVFSGSFWIVKKKDNKFVKTFYASSFYFIFKRIVKKNNQKLTGIPNPLIFFTKKEVFYQSDKLLEKVYYQDNIYVYQILKNAKSVKFTYKPLGYYYSNREGNSISLKWDDNKTNVWYNICLFYLNNDAQELIAMKLSMPYLKNEFIKKGIKFKIKRDFKFEWLPLIYRIPYYIYVKLSQKKLFEK